MEKNARKLSFPSMLFLVFAVWTFSFHETLASYLDDFPSFGPLIAKEHRRLIAKTDSGVISAVDVRDGIKRPYHLQFMTMEPGSLFLPVLLHNDMIFYVNSGRGTVTWVDDDGTDCVEVERGDIYRLEQGTVFYVHSHPDPTREKLRIHAIFDTISDINLPDSSPLGVYSSLSDMVRGFDERVLQKAFKASEEVIQAIKCTEKPSPIIPYVTKNKTDKYNWEERVLRAIHSSRRNPIDTILSKKKKKKTRTFNLLTTKPDVENCNGRSIAVTYKDFPALRGSDVGVFMVNLTRGSMMGPHWNPRATEIAIVIHGRGMVQIVCPSKLSEGGGADEGFKCENNKFRAKEGDLFIVPRFRPMVHISFNNDSFVFVGFSTNARKNYPQFLAGKWSVLKTIDRKILMMAFDVENTTIGDLLASQDEAVMLECTSCAEEAARKMEEEIERKKQEEERKREEEEAKKREEEAKKKEEEAKKREEEEAKKKEEEAQKGEEEEAQKREEEEARKREEEEEARKREEEAAKKREEEEAKKREEEAKRKEEEEKARKEEEEKARKQEEEIRRREEEEEAKRRREEQEQQEKEREKEEERARKQEEETSRREEEEEAKRREEQEQQETEREKEEARRREEEEQARRREEEIRRREEEEEAKERREEQEQEEGEARQK